ncbi:unnamed protein product [Lampetra fluviatilis]
MWAGLCGVEICRVGGACVEVGGACRTADLELTLIHLDDGDHQHSDADSLEECSLDSFVNSVSPSQDPVGGGVGGGVAAAAAVGVGGGVGGSTLTPPWGRHGQRSDVAAAQGSREEKTMSGRPRAAINGTSDCGGGGGSHSPRPAAAAAAPVTLRELAMQFTDGSGVCGAVTPPWGDPQYDSEQWHHHQARHHHHLLLMHQRNQQHHHEAAAAAAAADPPHHQTKRQASFGSRREHSRSSISGGPPPSSGAAAGGDQHGVSSTSPGSGRGDMGPGSMQLVECLLTELYDSGQLLQRGESFDSSTEASGTDRPGPDSNYFQELSARRTVKLQQQYLASKDVEELLRVRAELQERAALRSTQLVRQLRLRDRRAERLQRHCDVLTACLQAASQKRRIDTRLKFTVAPSPGADGFQQWYDALKAVARLPTGICKDWRRRVWLTLADQYLESNAIDWEKTLRFAFNDRSNPDDESMGAQIVKDLHRTGCSAYCGREAEGDRVVLKRVLLAYARWNKAVGYCQGFNVLAALVLEVTEGDEGEALKVMIYLIDKVLPDSYFANNLRSLSVEMAVFRDLLRLRLPDLSLHLDGLQRAANRDTGGTGGGHVGYEPPLTNVFTMQWFLTLFATCLPKAAVLRIWDSLFFEGSEVILRVALAIWAKLGERIEHCRSADEFYSAMGQLTQEMLEKNLVDCKELMQTVYSMAPFPFPQLVELREKYTYNITPFQAHVKPHGAHGRDRDSDDDLELEDDDTAAIPVTCLGPLGGLWQVGTQRPHVPSLRDHAGEEGGGGGGGGRGRSVAEASPGAVGSGRTAAHEHQAALNSMMMERMSTDIQALTRQYGRIRHRQRLQTHLVCPRTEPRPMLLSGPSMEPPPVLNHLMLSKQLQRTACERNCTVVRDGVVEGATAKRSAGARSRRSSSDSAPGSRCKPDSPDGAGVTGDEHEPAPHGREPRGDARPDVGSGSDAGSTSTLGSAGDEGPHRSDGVTEEPAEGGSASTVSPSSGCCGGYGIDASEKPANPDIARPKELASQPRGRGETASDGSDAASAAGAKDARSSDNSSAAAAAVPDERPVAEGGVSRPVFGDGDERRPKSRTSSTSSAASARSVESRGSSDASEGRPGSSAGPRAPAFNPFPSAKTPRKSAAAKNLGLYGSGGRTAVPPMSRHNGRASGKAGS